MSDDPLRDFSGTARLFPLPNVVLFPHVIQGLHIFEPRYRQMTADALAGDGLIAMVLQKPDGEGDPPPIEAVACVGRIVWHEKLPDGRYNLRLQGLSRARIIEEVSTDRLYRTARVDLLPDKPAIDLPVLARLRRDLAAAVLPRFEEGSPAQEQLRELFDGELPLGQVCDVLSYALPLPVELKQTLLADPYPDRRATLLADALKISAARADRPFPPPFSEN